MPPVPASAPPVIRLTDRQEAFCQAMACNDGGAEATRRAGYSAKGAKQRGAFLMRQPEIRIRVQQLRANRQCSHQALLDDAAVQVQAIITDALEKKSCGLALRAIEFRLKLHGVIQDRRIAHHYHLSQRHPDADLEHLDCDPQEEFDALPSRQPAKAIAPKAPALPAPVVTSVDDLITQAAKPTSESKPPAKIVTRSSDRPRFLRETRARALTPIQAASFTSPRFTVCRSVPRTARTAAGDMLSAR
jgi:phage terminase small subunit